MRLYVFLAALCVGLFTLSLFTGAGDVSAAETLRGYLGAGDPLIALVMQELRFPRAVLAALIGAALGFCGAAMQGFMRNPLAEPGIIGASGFAALGAVLALHSGLAAVSAMVLPAMGLIGAAVAVILLLLLAGPGASTSTLILAGVALSAASGALISLILNLVDNPFAANEISFWLMGSLVDRSNEHLWLALPVMLIGFVLIWRVRHQLDALSMGEETAVTMGVDVRRLRFRLIGGTACLIGAATSVAGAIGFVGLVVPHILRPLTNGLPSRLLGPAALGGAALVSAADIAVRIIAPGRDLKLGVLTALLGTPVFLHLIWRTRGQES